MERLVRGTGFSIIRPAVLPSAQAGSLVITERVILRRIRADTAVGIRLIADTAEEPQVLMTLTAVVIGAEVVMNNARVMDTLIVLICTPVVEPLAVPRSSSVATATSPTAPASPTAPDSRASSRSRAYYTSMSLPDLIR